MGDTRDAVHLFQEYAAVRWVRTSHGLRSQDYWCGLVADRPGKCQDWEMDNNRGGGIVLVCNVVELFLIMSILSFHLSASIYLHICIPTYLASAAIHALPFLV